MLGLDFGNLSIQQTTQAPTNNTQNTQDQGLDLFADQNQTQSQPQSQNQPPQNIQTQQAQPSKVYYLILLIINFSLERFVGY